MCCQGDGADSCKAAPLGQQRPAGHGVGSESTAAAVPCSAPDLQLPAAKGPAGGTGIWAEFQAIAPLGTCCFFFCHACANDGKKTQQGRAKHEGSDSPSRDRQGQRVTPGLTQRGLTPSCVCALWWGCLDFWRGSIHKQPPHSSAPQRAPCLRDHGGEDQRLWGHRMPWLSPWLLSLQGAAQIQAACFFTVRVMGEPPRDAGGEERGGRSTTGCTQQGQQLPEDTHRK